MRYENRLARKGFSQICGIDEAGRGPLAGPVVAAAVILSKRSRRLSKIHDSKQLSPKRRELLYVELMRHSVVGIGIVGEKVIDRINILRAAIRAMEKAVRNLGTPADCLLIDGPIHLGLDVFQMPIRGGDRISRSVAAASIVAKVTRDRIMTDYDRSLPGYGFSRHKGYPTRVHHEALKTLGPSPIHRLSYRPLRRLLAGA